MSDSEIHWKYRFGWAFCKQIGRGFYSLLIGVCAVFLMRIGEAFGATPLEAAIGVAIVYLSMYSNSLVRTIQYLAKTFAEHWDQVRREDRTPPPPPIPHSW